MRTAALSVTAVTAITVAAAITAVTARTALAAEPPREIVRKILDARDPADHGKLVDALVAGKPDPREVAKWFAEGRAYAADVPKGWLDREVRGGDGKERPYLLYVPEDYAPGKKRPFLVDMHGGVSRPAPLDHRELEQMKFFWGDYAESEGVFLAIPSGEAGAEWWTEVGAGSVLSILAEARRTYDVDENRVFATGFSDGGSGSFYLALAAPTPLAGIIPLNGHVAVAQAGGLEVHLRNFANVPIYAVNTENDQLYPPASMKPVIAAMKELGARVTWREIAAYGHDPSYLPEERPAIAAWMRDLRRDPQPKRLVWEGTAPARVRWLRVTELGERGGSEFPDVNPKLPPGRVRIGVVVDQAFGGPGVRVTDVQEGMPAAAMGIKAGDVILALDTTDIAGMADLQRVLRTKTFGDAFRVRLRRGEETIDKEGKFPDARPEEAFRRGAAYGSIEAEVKGEVQVTAYPPLSATAQKGNIVEVRANGIRAFEIYLGEPLFDLSQPVVVRVNGQTVHEGVVAPDLRFLAEQAAADDDRAMIYLARLRITVPKGS